MLGTSFPSTDTILLSSDIIMYMYMLYTCMHGLHQHGCIKSIVIIIIIIINKETSYELVKTSLKPSVVGMKKIDSLSDAHQHLWFYNSNMHVRMVIIIMMAAYVMDRT